MELMPLFASVIPEASRKRLARNPPRGPMFAKDIERHIQKVKATTASAPLVCISRQDVMKIVNSLGMRVSPKKLPRFAEAINAALLEYDLRLQIERMPLSSWLPRYKAIVFLLRKLRALLPDKGELLFNIISHFGESYAASHGPHLNLPPYHLANPLHNFPFTVNYRSYERLEHTIKGINEIAAWMQAFLDAQVDEVTESNEKKMSASVWLIGYELPRIYEKHFKVAFGVALATKSYGPGIRFIRSVLDAAGIVTPAGTTFSAVTIKTYRRRARKYDKR
jgi:hypothetical protein